MKKSLVTLAVLAATGLSAGCATNVLDGKLQNRVTTTLDCERGFFASLWGPLGFTAEIDKADVAHLPCPTKPATK